MAKPPSQLVFVSSIAISQHDRIVNFGRWCGRLLLACFCTPADGEFLLSTGMVSMVWNASTLWDIPGATIVPAALFSRRLLGTGRS